MDDSKQVSWKPQRQENPLKGAYSVLTLARGESPEGSGCLTFLICPGVPGLHRSFLTHVGFGDRGYVVLSQPFGNESSAYSQFSVLNEGTPPL